MINIKEKIEIAGMLQKHHYFFRVFWDLCDVSIEDQDQVDTGAIAFDMEGDGIRLILNKTFWESSNEATRMFLLCHEMLHIVLDHPKRFQEFWGKEESRLANYATDVVINHMLVDKFNIDRSELAKRIAEEGCWVDTVFKDKPDVSYNESSEYYFNKLKEDPQNQPQVKTTDVHIPMDAETAQAIADALEESGAFEYMDKELIEKIASSPKEFEELQKQQEKTRGAGGGGWTQVKVKKTRKRKWETVIKKWETRTKTKGIDTVSRWDRVAPRYTEIMADGRFYLPSDNWTFDEYYKEHSIDVYFFLDVSGSCYHLKERFVNAANSLDPKRFKVRCFTFDTAVHEVDIKTGKIYGGGGTSFSILENKIQEIMKKENRKYPHSVWVITDGYGDNVKPEKPEKWNWFLTKGNSVSCIPKESNKYNLENFE